MYNTCSSTLFLRCQGPISFSFNDNSFFSNDRLPFSSQSCCACCSTDSRYRVPVNPSYLIGLRQSTLIQWSSSRRVILDGGDRCYSRSPVYAVGQSCCCGHGCPIKEKSVSCRAGRLGERRVRSMISEGKRRSRRSVDANVAEVMLSLLTEEVGVEYLGVRERNGWSSRTRRAEVNKGGSSSSSSSGTSCRNKRKDVTSGLLEGNLKHKVESVATNSREEDYGHKEERRKEDGESYVRGEKHRTRRKDGSSCSSYHSCSSLGEFESDSEVQVRQEGCRAESENGFKRDSYESRKVTYDGKIMEEVNGHEEGEGTCGVVMQQQKTAAGSYASSSGVECDWRKKSEKKLAEVSFEQNDSWEKSSNKHKRSSEAHETDYKKASSSHQQFDDTEQKSNLVRINDETRQQYSTKGDQTSGQSESRMKYKSDIEANTSSENRFWGREHNLTADGSLVQETRHERTKRADVVSRKDDHKRTSQQLNEVSKFQEINVRRASSAQRESEAGVKKLEDKSSVSLRAVQDMEEHHLITGEWDSRQMDSRRKYQQLTEISDTQDKEIGNKTVSVRQSEFGMKSPHGNVNIISGSSEEFKEQHFQTDQVIRKKESRKLSQDTRNKKVDNSSDAQVIDTQRTSDMRISSEETYSASVVKSSEETVERHNLAEEQVFQIGSRKETQRPRKALSFSEGTSEEASSYQKSWILETQPTVQLVGLGVGNRVDSQAVGLPPPSQLEASATLDVESTTDLANQEDSSARLESGSNALRRHTELKATALHHEIDGATRAENHGDPLNLTSHEDALGSADRFQKSSMHFVGEFVEKMTHEVSTSETQNEKLLSEKVLVNEGRKRQQKSSNQFGSGDLKSKEYDSRRSSRSSGAKGPSDEIWNVTDSSIHVPGKTEAPESDTPTTNTIAKRTGRSMWNIISDIVRLRWTSRSENHNLALKSGGRSSPNQSTSSEAWFSGHELDENSDESKKKEKKGLSLDSRSSDQQHLVRIPVGSQGEGSRSASPQDKIGHVGVDVLSSSSIFETGSASERISSAATAGNLQWTGTAIVESSVSMPSLRARRSPRVDEVSEADKTDATASRLLVQEQAIGTGLTDLSGTERKNEELKRKKLQRNNQVLKDNFDDWAVAHQLEIEQRKIDEIFMREALLEARKAADIWEVPVGAVLVQHGKIIARGCNLVEQLRDSTAHAEMICIREASNLLRSWRLSDTTLYVTLEPCPMCAGAVLQARIDTVVWGAPNKLLGADGSWIRLFPDGGEGGSGLEATDKPPAPVHPFHPKIAIRRGILAAECSDAMQQFFQLRRRKEKSDSPPSVASCLPVSNHPSKFFSKMHDAFHLMFCL